MDGTSPRLRATEPATPRDQDGRVVPGPASPPPVAGDPGASLDFHARLLDAAGEAIAATDPQGTVIYWNRAAEELYGWTADEVIGRHVFKFTAGEFMDRVAEIVATVSSGKTWSRELVVYHRNGTPFLARLTETPVFDDRGQLVAVIGVSCDISRSRQAEDELALLERRTELILSSIGEGIHVVDRDGRVLLHNPAAAAMLGRSANEILGQDSHALLHYTRADGSAYPTAECPILRTMQDGVARRVHDEVFFGRTAPASPWSTS